MGEDEIREDRLRQVAEGQGLKLGPRHDGRYLLSRIDRDADSRHIGLAVGKRMTLDEVEEYLAHPQ